MARTREEIIAAVNDVLVAEFEVDAATITPESQLQEDLGIDSLDAVDLIVALEEALGVGADEDAAKKIATAGELYDFVERALSP